MLQPSSRNHQIILASSSPRRKQLLEGIGIDFQIREPYIDESPWPDEKALPYTRRMAQEKGLSIYRDIPRERNSFLVISCDTTVSIDNKILGKPIDKEDAHRMLQLLRHRKHYVISAMALSYYYHGHRISGLAHSVAAVFFKDYPDIFIEKYLDKDEWCDKAGSYAIQGLGSGFVDYFQGSLTTIIGFPIRLFYRMLVNMRIDVLKLYRTSKHK